MSLGLSVERESRVSLAGVDAAAYAQQTIAGRLKAARKYAAMSQAELAAKLKVGPAHVSNCEAGRERIGERMIVRWLAVCGLPTNWKPTHAKRPTAGKTKG